MDYSKGKRRLPSNSQDHKKTREVSHQKTRSPKNIILQSSSRPKRQLDIKRLNPYQRMRWGSPVSGYKKPTPTGKDRPKQNFFSSNKRPAPIRLEKQRVSADKKQQEKETLRKTIRPGTHKAIKLKPSLQIMLQHENTSKIKERQENPFFLLQEDFKIYGNRFPEGFNKLKLLGQGGFAIVWEGQHRKSNRHFAIKQILTANQHETHKKQIWFGTFFFQLGGIAKRQFKDHPGIGNLARLFSYEVNRTDTWLIYQRCGDSLGKSLYQLQEVNMMGMDISSITYKPLYCRMQANNKLLKEVIRQIALALDLLSCNSIVHSDLKPENVLVRCKGDLIEVKLIDFGSCFKFQGSYLDQFSMATPEYMSPELLSFIQKQNGKPFNYDSFQKVQQYTDNPWVVDIWSLGCIILQIIHGVPLWHYNQTIVQQGDGRKKTAKGAFAVQGRKFDKIIKKQRMVLKDLDGFVKDQCNSGIIVDEDLLSVLKGCLQEQPWRRISPRQVASILNCS